MRHRMSRPRSPVISPGLLWEHAPRLPANGEKASRQSRADRREVPRAGRGSGQPSGGGLWLWGSHPVLAAWPIRKDIVVACC